MHSSSSSSVSVIEGMDPIIVGNDLVGSGYIAEDLRRRVPKATKFVIITDCNVFPLYGPALVASIEKELKVKPFVKVIPPGEESKSRQVKEEIEDFMLAKACNRDTCVVSCSSMRNQSSDGCSRQKRNFIVLLCVHTAFC